MVAKRKCYSTKKHAKLIISLLSLTFLAFSTTSSLAAEECSQDNSGVTPDNVFKHSKICNDLQKIDRAPSNTNEWCFMAVGNYLCKNITARVENAKCVPYEKFTAEFEGKAKTKGAELMDKCTKYNTVPPFSGTNPFWRRKK